MTGVGQGRPEHGRLGLWAAGYTAAELNDAQARYALRFPPDLVALLRDRRLAAGYDWPESEDPIQRAVAWPLEGLPATESPGRRPRA